MKERLWQNQQANNQLLSIEENRTIALQSELQAEITIHASPERVLQTFRCIENWHLWYPGVIAASWQVGLPWAVQAKMQVQVKNSLGRTVNSVATVQPSSNDLLVWENHALGLITLCRAQVFLEGNGTRFILHKAYSGAAVVLLQLLKTRQKRMLQQGLQNLEKLVLFPQKD